MLKKVGVGFLTMTLAVALFAEGAAALPDPVSNKPRHARSAPAPASRPAPSVERRHDRRVEARRDDRRRDDGRRDERRRDEWRDRGRHRGGNTGAFLAAGAIGLFAGAALASANRYDPPSQPLPYDDVDPYTGPYAGREDASDWHSYCAAKYSTYNPRDGMYVAVDGRRYPCH